MNYILLSILWGLYFTTHSVLASHAVKNFFYENFSNSKRYYRLLYNLIAISTLIPLSYYSLATKDAYLVSPSSTVILGVVFLITGIVLLIVAFASFNIKEFIGIEQLMEKENTDSKLVVSGMYKIVRHPLYFALIILFLGIFFLIPTVKILLVNIIVMVYLVIGSRLEEKKLMHHFGQEYADYKKRVKALIPFIY